MRIRWLAASLVVAALLAAPVASAEPIAERSAAQTRLLDVWLDLQLVALMYPASDPKTFAANVVRVAKQLHQPLPRIRQGHTPDELSRYPVGTVLVKLDSPPNVLILYSRTADNRIWQLTDDAKSHLRVVELRAKPDPLAA